MRRRVVLVKPPEASAFSFGAFSLGVLAAAVRDVADVEIVDATDLTVDGAVAQVRDAAPDLVGVTVMGFMSVPAVERFIRAVRACLDITVVAGGHGATLDPTPLLDAGADAVVVGEGEQTFRDLLVTGIRPGLPGLACRDGGRLVQGPARPLIRPLDALRPPARDLMPAPRDGVHLMETSRGCPHACDFCEATRFYGRRWRAHSPERVAAEVRRLVEDCDATMIHFADDNFSAGPRRILDICASLQRGPLPAFFMTSARVDDLLADSRVLPAMAEARILRISVGVETLDRTVGALVNKPLSFEACRDAFARMRELGIFSVASFIVGLPGESPEMRAQAVDLAVAAAPDSAQFLPLFPLPGTPLASATGPDPRPEDVRDAVRCTESFFAHPEVRGRLEATAARGGVAGLLAAGTLDRRPVAAVG